MTEKKIERPKEEKEALKKLLFGEWVDCDLVQSALDIDFSAGLKLFDFSRTVEWNPPPLNGQRVITKFKLKSPALKVGQWVREGDNPTRCSMCLSKALHSRSAWCPSCGAAMMSEIRKVEVK